MQATQNDIYFLNSIRFFLFSKVAFPTFCLNVILMPVKSVQKVVNGKHIVSLQRKLMSLFNFTRLGSKKSIMLYQKVIFLFAFFWFCLLLLPLKDAL